MARLTRVEVHFVDNSNIPRKVLFVPTADQQKQVQAVFLHDHAESFLKGFKKADVKKLKDAPGGSLGGDVGIADSSTGLEGVCYLINGSLFCWMPE